MIVNGTECEPYMTSDYRRMLESTEELVEGLRIVLSLFERATGVFAIEDNKRDAITAIQMASGSESRMEVRVLETKYPQGAERMLIYACTGTEIHGGSCRRTQAASFSMWRPCMLFTRPWCWAAR